ncbi:hypothetical protein L195_g036917, partial [Trifolium pratense]
MATAAEPVAVQTYSAAVAEKSNSGAIQ